MKRNFTKAVLLLIVSILLTLSFGACKKDNGDNNNEGGSNNPVVYSLQLSADKTQAKAGEQVTLTATLKSAEKEEKLSGLTYTITEGAAFATVSGNVLTVNESAEAGSVIKVKTNSNGIDSNEITVTVVKDEVALEGNYFIDCPESKLTIDKKGNVTPTLAVEVYDYNYQKVEDVPVKFYVEEGADLLDVVQDGYSCSFVAKGHGTAKLAVKVEGTSVVEYVDVNVIVPPETVALPEVFAERPFAYAFSKVDKLPFAPSAIGEALACKEFDFDFMHESGAVGDEVAVYEDGKIEFKMTGKVVVTIRSASGSKVEARTTYTFDINDGVNVYSHAELKAAASATNGNTPINIVILEKPVGEGADYNYEYGYDVVPEIALRAKQNQTIADILAAKVEIGAYNKNFWLNGNDHCIDISQLRIYNESELTAYCNEKGWQVEDYKVIYNILCIGAWNNNGPSEAEKSKAYNVKLYNVSVKGNCAIDYAPSQYNASGRDDLCGVTMKGITIGTYDYFTDYYIDAKGITVSQCYGGLQLTHIVGNGKISDVYAYNCYSTGIFARASIVTLENLKFGPCGATGIELVPDNSDRAGINDNEKQHVTILGNIEASTNLNDGNTSYFQHYNIMGATVPQIINGNIQAYEQYGVDMSHIRNDQGQFIFVSLKFINISTMAGNVSIVDYPAYQNGGIIDITALAGGVVDTEHQFIRMPIMVNLGAQMEVGSALFYNQNYIPAN